MFLLLFVNNFRCFALFPFVFPIQLHLKEIKSQLMRWLGEFRVLIEKLSRYCHGSGGEVGASISHIKRTGMLVVLFSG